MASRLPAALEPESLLATTSGRPSGSVPCWVTLLKSPRRGPDLSALTLSPSFAHIWSLPLAGGVIGVHIFLIVKHGDSAFPDKED